MVEGMSVRAISRTSGRSTHTILKLLEDAGDACAAHHDEAVRGVRAKRIQMDEVWSFVYAKAKNVEGAAKAPPEAGEIWTWIALDADRSWSCRGGSDLGTPGPPTPSCTTCAGG